MQQGNYPIGQRTLAPTDTCTGVVTGGTADIPLGMLAAFIAANLGGLSGPTISRPIPSYVGQPYFDTSYGFPVWVKQISPAIWVTASGVQV